MLLIAPVDRKVKIKAHPSDKTKPTAVTYIRDSHLVQVKSSQYYRRKIASGELICVSETDTPPEDWYKTFHPVQQDRIIEAAKKRAAFEKAEAAKKAKADKAAKEKAKKAAEAKKTAEANKAATETK